MSKKLFVGGLAWETTEHELREVFGRYGEVTEVKIITDRDTGRSRGFGFVTFVNNEDANKAIEEGNGMELGGRTLTVNEARERPPRRGGGGGGGGRGRW
jgi:RNA recognition motif-containing protein